MTAFVNGFTPASATKLELREVAVELQEIVSDYDADYNSSLLVMADSYAQSQGSDMSGIGEMMSAEEAHSKLLEQLSEVLAELECIKMLQHGINGLIQQVTDHRERTYLQKKIADVELHRPRDLTSKLQASIESKLTHKHARKSRRSATDLVASMHTKMGAAFASFTKTVNSLGNPFADFYDYQAQQILTSQLNAYAQEAKEHKPLLPLNCSDENLDEALQQLYSALTEHHYIRATPDQFERAFKQTSHPAMQIEWLGAQPHLLALFRGFKKLKSEGKTYTFLGTMSAEVNHPNEVIATWFCLQGNKPISTNYFAKLQSELTSPINPKGIQKLKRLLPVIEAIRKYFE